MVQIFPYLAYAGTIPFVFGAMCLAAGVQHLPVLGAVDSMLSVYALIILSFLSGTHWGQHLHTSGVCARSLAIVSNIMAVVLWLGFLLLSFKVLLGLFVLAFVLLLLIDQRLLKNEMISKKYFDTRLLVSSIAIVSLIISVIV